MTFPENIAMKSHIHVMEDDLEPFMNLWIFLSHLPLVHLFIFHYLLNNRGLILVDLIILIVVVSNLDNTRQTWDMNAGNWMAIKHQIFETGINQIVNCFIL